MIKIQDPKQILKLKYKAYINNRTSPIGPKRPKAHYRISIHMYTFLMNNQIIKAMFGSRKVQRKEKKY